MIAVIVAQGIPLAPSLEVRLIALAVIEVVLLTAAVLLYIRWAQFKREPLDEWWERRKQAGFSPRTRALMEEEEREKVAAQGGRATHAFSSAETAVAQSERASGPPH